MRLIALTLGAATLMACAGSGNESATAPASNGASIGATSPAPAFVAQVFDDVCISTLPDYAGAATALQRLGFSQAASGTYYDGQNNLSVRLIGTPPSKCSVVWGVRDNPSGHLTSYAEALKAREPLDLSTASFGTPTQQDGVTYFNTRTSAK